MLGVGSAKCMDQERCVRLMRRTKTTSETTSASNSPRLAESGRL